MLPDADIRPALGAEPGPDPQAGPEPGRGPGPGSGSVPEAGRSGVGHLEHSRIAGLLLAAGAGSRLGRPKALVELGGLSLAERGVALLREGGTDPVIMVTGAAPVSLPGGKLIKNWPVMAGVFPGVTKVIVVSPVKDHQRAGASMTLKNFYGFLGGRRNVFHQDINYPDKLHKLLAEHGDDVEQEKFLALEGWFVLKARRPGVSARKLAAEYGLEELRHYINRSQCEIDKCRGWEFA